MFAPHGPESQLVLQGKTPLFSAVFLGVALRSQHKDIKVNKVELKIESH